MVARIKRTSSLSKTLNYNEKKVQRGVAENIMAVNFAKDLENMNFHDKLRFLQRQASLRESVKVNSVHITLNFHPTDQLDNTKLMEIAGRYMTMIGFGDQPYLVYRHNDAGHPHIHIATTNIRSDGSKIEMNNIGKDASEPARKFIELKYGLVKAAGSKVRPDELKPVSAHAVEYGKGETRQAIANVLNYVLPTYRYTSLPELNTVLRLYNVMADRGPDGSRIHKNNGLLYRVLDEGGKPIGVPIKSSNMPGKPTLAFLEKKFSKNRNIDSFEHRRRVRLAVDIILRRNPKFSLEDLRKALVKDGIYMALRTNSLGTIYGITYVDTHYKTVFNGSDLGRDYSANGIQARCKPKMAPPDKTFQQRKVIPKGWELVKTKMNDPPLNYCVLSHGIGQTVALLFQTWLEPVPGQVEYIPYQWRIGKRKKRRRGLSP